MKKRFFALVLVVILVMMVFSGCSKKDENTVTVASKQFTENILMGEMLAQMIEAKTELKVERKLNLGGTSVIIPAVEEEEVDIYFEYTGTLCSEALKVDTSGGLTAEQALEYTVEGMNEEYDVKFFDPVGINNTYALGLPREKYDELGITTISELAEYAGDLVFGSAHTFRTRVSDGYDALLSTYDLSFKDDKIMDSTLLYEAADAGEVDVMVAFATDALLKKYDIVLLEDDLALFPPYEGAALCRNEVLEAHPELDEVLNLLAGKIDDELMQNLNYQVDIEKRAVDEVAAEALEQLGILKN